MTMKYRCDGIPQCEDGSDEIGCNVFTVEFSVDMNCVEGYTAEDDDIVYIGLNLGTDNVLHLADEDNDGIWTGTHEVSADASYMKVSVQRDGDDAYLYEDFDDEACTEEYLVDGLGSFGYWRPIALTENTAFELTFGQCNGCPTPDIYGCMDSNANNYNPDATMAHICIYDVNIAVDMSCSGYTYEEGDNLFFATTAGDALALTQDTDNPNQWSGTFALQDDVTH